MSTTAQVALQERRTLAARGLWAIYVLLSLGAVAAPALMVRMPPILDYPNHYVRLWLLGGAAKTEPLSQMYAVDWSAAWTNIGVDLLAQAVGGFIPVSALGPMLLAAALVLPPAGAILLHRRLFGARRAWQVGIPLAAFATTLLAGFLNYHVGLGLALMAAAADPWIARRSSPPAHLIARIAIAAGLMVVHIFALGFYAVILGGLALGPRLVELWNGPALRAAALRLAAVAAPVAVPLLAFRLAARHVPGEAALGPIWGPETLKYKIDVLLCAFATYDVRIDTLFLGSLGVLAAFALVRRTLRVHQGLVVGALGLIGLALIAPTWLADTGWIDTRLPIMALLILLAAVDPGLEERSKRGAQVIAAALVLLVIGRSAWIGDIWSQRQGDIRAVDAALAHVPAGAAVLPLEHRPSIRGKNRAPPGRYFHFGAGFYHQYTLSVIERGAFSPLVFAMPGKQPLQVKSPWNEIAAPNGGRSPPLSALTDSTGWLKSAPYVADWRARFDYALMLNADLLPDVKREPVPEGLTLVADEGFARLYRISR